MVAAGTAGLPLEAPVYPADQVHPLAIAALLSGLLGGPFGIIMGTIALGAIRRTGMAGRRYAIWGIVIGCLSVLAAIIVLSIPWPLLA